MLPSTKTYGKKKDCTMVPWGQLFDIRMRPGENLKTHLPASIIIDMDEYDGPIWETKIPPIVPIPCGRIRCKKRDAADNVK